MHPFALRATFALCILATAPAAHAANVWINPALGVTTVDGVAGARYKLDNGNWDQALHSGAGTNTASGPTQDFISESIGNYGSLNGDTLGFTFSHVAGKGFRFTLSGIGTGGGSYTLSWGDASLGGENTATLARSGGPQAAPTSPFNLLLIEARAEIDDLAEPPPTAPEPDSSMSFSNLSFTTTAPVSIAGSFTAGSADENTPGSAFTPPGEPVTDGRIWQFVYADFDLSTIDWTISGDVTGFRNPLLGVGGTELVRFEVTAKNATVVPVPAAAWLFVPALAGLAGRVRRR